MLLCLWLCPCHDSHVWGPALCCARLSQSSPELPQLSPADGVGGGPAPLSSPGRCGKFSRTLASAHCGALATAPWWGPKLPPDIARRHLGARSISAWAPLRPLGVHPLYYVSLLQGRVSVRWFSLISVATLMIFLALLRYAWLLFLFTVSWKPASLIFLLLSETSVLEVRISCLLHL